VGFFAYRRYDKTAADQLLAKIKNFSFSKEDTYTTTITDINGSGKIIASDTTWKLLEEISDTTWSTNTTNDQIVQQILTEERLQEGVVVPWISGKVIIQNGKVYTISAVPQAPAKDSTTTTLSEEDKRQAEEFAQMFSN